MALAPGLRLGPYELVSLVGVGGMGEVYRARDTRLDRTVAIKLLPAAVRRPAGSTPTRFEVEARAISSLSIPTSARCSTSASRTAGRSSSWSTSKARRWTIG